MKHAFWQTAVALITLILATSACSPAQEEITTLEINGPAFILFYTDN